MRLCRAVGDKVGAEERAIDGFLCHGLDPMTTRRYTGGRGMLGECINGCFVVEAGMRAGIGMSA